MPDEPNDEELVTQALALQQRLNLSGDEKLINILGGTPRAFERYILANGNDLDAAADGLKATLSFREDRGLDAGVSPEILAKVAPHWVGARCGVSESENAIIWFAFGNLAPTSLMREISEEEFASFYLSFMDEALAVQNEHNSPGTRSSSWRGAIEVLDLNGICASQLNPQAVLMLSRVLGLGQMHYPDNLRNGKTVFINAPYAFWGAWAILKQVLHQSTLDKIEILSDDGTELLCELMGGQAKLDEVKRRAQAEGAFYVPPEGGSWLGSLGSYMGYGSTEAESADAS
mmetsp:Transcript_2235/g.4652  ORF Transcript_2235/g.4652 Transcript_2235/m.4652 type:complete len:288 (-) Transcript_2235:627-1490(-)|eukprot:CAMPEP_0183351466 /NCGR_PEP_ID=MMETSP0164_2-20130417/25021_1 /TAXON_ID=221442 /ORGANISM="Coccolithus pelagicus ssp braarudi, Strain PLY182g" /LENGTH=287 /DNA_ID=CAMNT_0025523655 /DNA_START=49 /DNA_END=912 /DNA_ORIENTATION=+